MTEINTTQEELDEASHSLLISSIEQFRNVCLAIAQDVYENKLLPTKGLPPKVKKESDYLRGLKRGQLQVLNRLLHVLNDYRDGVDKQAENLAEQRAVETEQED